MAVLSLNQRSSGILLHPTSLPSPIGIGDLGREAFQFVSDLKKAGQTWWQMLPIGPVDILNSPYNSPSAFAGNPLLIDLRQLVHENWLTENDLNCLSECDQNRVNYSSVTATKEALFRIAFANFQAEGKRGIKKKLINFCLENKSWLDSFALFSALKRKFNGICWTEWPLDVATRRTSTLDTLSLELQDDISYHKFVQFLFFSQWARLKNFAARKEVGLIGDIPIFMALDSADVWANPDLFHLGSDGKPSLVAGVPPDYFSKTGQLWGNPLYRWDRHAETGFDWWMRRMRHLFTLFDAVRIDHFIGFYRAWAVPADAKNAVGGTWMPGPRETFFDNLYSTLLNPLLIAEDLGLLTPEVEALRDKYHLPGMKVLHFAFGNPSDKTFKRPMDYPVNCVVYTGTHDNNTTLGWWETLKNPSSDETETKSHEEELAFILKYIGSAGIEINWDLISLAFKCPAQTAIIPMQDVLGLGYEGRMNIPSTKLGNWEWRMKPGAFSNKMIHRLKNLVQDTNRTKERVPIG